MQAFVYTDKSLERYAGRFVWLSINTEDPKNASFLKRYPLTALPTILVIDARRDKVALRYIGGATLAQVKQMLDDASKTVAARSQTAADARLAEADRLASAGKHAEAAAKYDAAISEAPRSWSKLTRTAEAAVFTLAMTDPEKCGSRAVALVPRVKGTSAAANIAATGLMCTMQLPKEHPQRAKLAESLEKAAREALRDPKIVLPDDDRSSLYLALLDAREAAADTEEASRLKQEWADFLEAAAAKAATPAQRAVYDAHRLTAYRRLGTPEKAVPMLEQSERDFPTDYNPPLRLSSAYRAMKQYDLALAASDRALGKAAGSSRVNVLMSRADVLAAKGDKDAARTTLTQAITEAKALPEGQRDERWIGMLEQRLARIQ